MDELNRMDILYLIFVPKDDQVKKELEAMQKDKKKIKIYEFEHYKDKKKRECWTYLAFLKQIFDHVTEIYYGWSFAKNLSEIDLQKIIRTYKLRWNIEIIFKVQDQCKIQTKSKEIKVRYFLFAYKQLIEALWYLHYKKVIFKRYLIELSDACTEMVDNEEKRKYVNKQASGSVYWSAIWFFFSIILHNYLY